MIEPYYQEEGITLYCAKAEDVLPHLRNIDAVVTDSPYGLSFMGKHWDYDVPKVELWELVYAVMKPGAHLLTFAGTRTYHRMVCAIEDAGFEIRDMIAWVYSQGFPKGQDVAWEMHKKACMICGSMIEYDYESESTNSSRGADAIREHGMRFVRATYLQTPVYACAECGQVLQPFMSEQEAQELRTSWAKSETIWPEQSGMEGGRDVEAPEGQLSRCEICQMSHRVLADGSEGWIHHGASACYGTIPWQVAGKGGGRPSYRPQSGEQLHRQPDAFRIERAAQTRRGFNVALKPALEPIVIARKPLEGTVAENVLKYGTGGINVDGCRVGTEVIIQRLATVEGGKAIGAKAVGVKQKATGEITTTIGRWPANLIHDGSDGVVGLFPVTTSGELRSGHKQRRGRHTHEGGYVGGGIISGNYGGDSGSAARFFYCAKASKSERGNGNNHPTVKPLALMRYLCRLVTPLNGIVLDPFVGSGTTLIAARMEGFQAIGIEMEEEYCKIAKARLNSQREMQLKFQAK